MKKSIALLLFSFLCTSFCFTQNVNITLNNSNPHGLLSSKMLDDCMPIIEKKLNEFCESIEYIGSYDNNISSQDKRRCIDAIKLLFFKFDDRIMTITSRSYPDGKHRKLRAYLNNLLIQSFGENQPIYKIDNVDVAFTSNRKKIDDPKAWLLVNRYPDGTELYESTFKFHQEYSVKSRTIRIGNPETHEPPQTHVVKDVDTKLIKVYIVLSPKIEGGFDALIRLGDIYASYLEK